MTKYFIPLGIGVVIVLLAVGVLRSGDNDDSQPEENGEGTVLAERTNSDINEGDSLTMAGFTIDTASSTLEWSGKKRVGAQHFGTVTIDSGELTVDDAGALEGGTIVADMTSITDNDLEGAGKEKLEGHLKSDDFFSVEQNPTAAFSITSVTETNGQTMISGPLTIKGITNTVSAPAEVVVGDSQVTLSSEFTFDRAKYDIRFGSGSFFEDLGDNLIEDEVRVSLNVVATK